MCISTDVPAPAPAPKAPPVLEQVAPKSKSDKGTDAKKRRNGLNRYKIQNTDASAPSTVGGLPKVKRSINTPS